jgi:hypothetical protein
LRKEVTCILLIVLFFTASDYFVKREDFWKRVLVSSLNSLRC